MYEETLAEGDREGLELAGDCKDVGMRLSLKSKSVANVGVPFEVVGDSREDALPTVGEVFVDVEDPREDALFAVGEVFDGVDTKLAAVVFCLCPKFESSPLQRIIKGKTTTA